MSKTLRPYQIPQGVYEVRGRKSIEYSGNDVSLYCRQDASGNMKVVLADRAVWDEVQEDYDVEVIDAKEAISLFGHNEVYNPLQDRVVDLVH